MSVERVSSTETLPVYVRLLNEGTDVMRPTEAAQVRAGVLRLLPTDDYDPEDEHWEFPPGSVVSCEQETREGEVILVAKALVSE